MSNPRALYECGEVWDPNLQLGQIRVIQALIDTLPRGFADALDVGCGDGKITRALLQHFGPLFVGLDSSHEALRRCDFPVVHGDAACLPFPDGRFSLVTCIDTLEHLDDDSTTRAWNELFRVARDVVAVAVPFRENLLESLARCAACGLDYHLNWHHRSYDVPDLHQQAPRDWEVAVTVLTGEPWTSVHPLETAYRRQLLGERVSWTAGRCLRCNSGAHSNVRRDSVTQADRQRLFSRIHRLNRSVPLHRGHTELLVVFRRLESSVTVVPPAPECRAHTVDSATVEFPTCRIESVLPDAALAACAARTAAGQLVLQFPPDPDASAIQLDGIEPVDRPVTCRVRSGSYPLGEITLMPQGQRHISIPLDLPPQGTWSSGIILDIDSPTAPFRAARLSTRGLATLVADTRGHDLGYLPMETPWGLLHLQVLSGMRIFPHALQISDPIRPQAAPCRLDFDPRVHILMICHDQSIDRRIIAQAHTLQRNGCKVTIVALSFDANDHQEQCPSGLVVHRVGLRRLVANDAVSRATERLEQHAAALLHRLAGRLPGFWRVRGRIERLTQKGVRMGGRVVKAIRFGSLRSGHPLLFTAAFLDVCGTYTADLIQVHDLPALEAGASLSRQWQVPLVYDAHELYPEQRAFSSAQRRICRRAEQSLISGASLVFTVNDSIAEEMTKRYGVSRPTRLLNAIDPPEGFDPEHREDLLRNALRLPADTLIALYQGGLAPHRNLPNLVKAMARVSDPSIHLVFLGSGDFGATLQRLAGRLKLLRTRVHFLPAVPQEELLRFTASADFGVIPYPHVDLNSLYCTPNKLFEFIQAALPVLANDSPELRRFVADRNFGIARDLSSPKRIAKAIEEFSCHRDRGVWRRNLLKGRGEFLWSNESEVYLRALREHALIPGRERVRSELP